MTLIVIPIIAIISFSSIARALRVVRRQDFVDLFSATLDVTRYSNLQPIKNERLDEMRYADNQSFWQDAISNRHIEGRRVLLNEFHLTEWIPMSPGAYFLPASQEAVNEARKYYSYGGGSLQD